MSRSDSAAGPYDSWLKPQMEMSWHPSATPIDAPVAKLGGQPYWLDEPFWPVSATLGSPMMFIGQFPIPGSYLRMSYLFMAQDEVGTALTFEAEAGDNALIVQPGGRLPSFISGQAASIGPGLWRRGAQWSDRIPVELHVNASPVSEETATLVERRAARQDQDRRGVIVDDAGDLDFVECRSYVGGHPLFWQPWTTDIASSWRFFFQLDGAEGWGDDRYALNFGGGTGYAFLSGDEREGRFFWDCV